MQMQKNQSTVLASQLSASAFSGHDFSHEKFNAAEDLLCHAIKHGEWNNAPFSISTAGEIADEISVCLLNKPIRDLSTEEKISLLDSAANLGREELISLIISFLPDDIRDRANSVYDFVCMVR